MNPVSSSACRSWYRVSPSAPSTAGIESRNENLKAFSRFSPIRSAMAMVIPLLLIPGISAMPCAVPIASAVLVLMLSVFSIAFFVV